MVQVRLFVEYKDGQQLEHDVNYFLAALAPEDYRVLDVKLTHDEHQYNALVMYDVLRWPEEVPETPQIEAGEPEPEVEVGALTRFEQRPQPPTDESDEIDLGPADAHGVPAEQALLDVDADDEA